MHRGKLLSASNDRNVSTTRLAASVFGSLCCFASAQSQATDHDYAYLRQFGSYGSGNGQFVGPTYNLNFVAVDPSTHNILVEDGGNSRVEIFSSDGTYLRQFGSQGTGNGQFEGVSGIAVDPLTHNIVVGDWSTRVEIFNSNGVYLSQFGSPGSGDGQFDGIAAIAIDPQTRHIVVADLNNARVQVFDASGHFLGKFGSYGSGQGQFIYGLYLAIDPDSHNILVGDELNSNVQIFSSTGTWLSAFGSYGIGNGQFSNAPGAIAVDAQTHNIMVEDYANNRVQVFDTNGNYLSQFGGVGGGNGQFNASNGPTGMDIDQSTHNLVVLDRGNSRAEIFGLTTQPPPPQCGPTEVSFSMDPPIAPQSESILFTAEAEIMAPFAGTVSFVVDGTGTTCTANMNGITASCLHPLQTGMHSVVATYSGDGHNPAGCSAAQTITIVADGAQNSTNPSCTLTPDPAVQGQGIASMCVVAPGNGVMDIKPDGDGGSPTGYLTVADGGNVIGYVPLFDGIAYFETVLGGGSHALSSSYSGDGTYAASVNTQTIVVNIPSDDVFYSGFEKMPN